jgi:DNA-directed RNA polymerase subunit M/transcription elongation factor TFIIS
MAKRSKKTASASQFCKAVDDYLAAASEFQRCEHLASHHARNSQNLCGPELGRDVLAASSKVTKSSAAVVDIGRSLVSSGCDSNREILELVALMENGDCAAIKSVWPKYKATILTAAEKRRLDAEALAAAIKRANAKPPRKKRRRNLCPKCGQEEGLVKRKYRKSKTAIAARQSLRCEACGYTWPRPAE